MSMCTVLVFKAGRGFPQRKLAGASPTWLACMTLGAPTPTGACLTLPCSSRLVCFPEAALPVRPWPGTFVWEGV